jgi:probable rRNA maturation factor
MRIELFIEGNISLPSDRYKNISLKKIKSYANKICSFLNLKKIIITIVICDNKYIRKINRIYRKKDKSTDVIAFAYRENPVPNIKCGLEMLGDIYISLDKAAENAKAYGASFTEEIRRLIAHGILHLIGYDHERSKKDKRIMETKEKKIFNYVSTAHRRPVLSKPSNVFHKSSSE